MPFLLYVNSRPVAEGDDPAVLIRFARRTYGRRDQLEIVVPSGATFLTYDPESKEWF